MNVAVLVPRRSDNGRRDRTWAWLRQRWEHEHPDWQLVEGHHDDGPFNRSAAINRAAETAGAWNVAVVADADTFVDPDALRAAVALAASSGQLVLAFTDFQALTQSMSDRVMDGFLGDWHPGIAYVLGGTCSSMLAIPRELWDTAGGFDEGFVGWGAEDVAAWRVFATLGGGFHRLPGVCWHLWHPAAGENPETNPLWLKNLERLQRYETVDFDDPEGIKVLLAELRGVSA